MRACWPSRKGKLKESLRFLFSSSPSFRISLVTKEKLHGPQNNHGNDKPITYNPESLNPNASWEDKYSRRQRCQIIRTFFWLFFLYLSLQFSLVF